MIHAPSVFLPLLLAGVATASLAGPRDDLLAR